MRYTNKLLIAVALMCLFSLECVYSKENTGIESLEIVSLDSLEDKCVILHNREKLEELRRKAENIPIPIFNYGRHRSPNEKEYAVMKLMKVDSSTLEYEYFFPKDISDEDAKSIEEWCRVNNEILDEGLLNDAKQICRIERSGDYFNLPNVISVLDDNLISRVRWRRSVVENKRQNGGLESHSIGDCLLRLGNYFGENNDSFLSVKSIYLGFSDKAFIDALNFLNGRDFVCCEDFVLERQQLYKIKDWIWANEGNISDEMLYEIQYFMYLRSLLSSEGDDEEYDRLYDKCRDLNIIKID